MDDSGITDGSNLEYRKFFILRTILDNHRLVEFYITFDLINNPYLKLYNQLIQFGPDGYVPISVLNGGFDYFILYFSCNRKVLKSMRNLHY